MQQNQYQQEQLLDLIHEALLGWKAAEMRAEARGSAIFLRQRNRIRAESLKGIYLEMLKEARTRKLSLSSEQLLARILYLSCAGSERFREGRPEGFTE